MLRHRGADKCLHFWIQQFFLGLIVERWIGQLHADHGRQTFAQILAGWNEIFFLEQAHASTIIINDGGQRFAKRRDMRAAVAVWNIVAKCQQNLGNSVGVLQRQFATHSTFRVLAAHHHHRTHGGLAGVDELHISTNAGSIVECFIALLALRVHALVD